jgi:thiamine-phosphate pyrophosphorylase
MGRVARTSVLADTACCLCRMQPALGSRMKAHDVSCTGMLRYAITDRRLLGLHEATRRAGLRRYAHLAVEQRIDYLQVREKDLSAAVLIQVVRELATALAGSGVRLLVSGRCDVALAGDAAGVHLTSSAGELTVREARRIFEQDGARKAVVSVSCHTLADVEHAVGAGREERPDAILFGPVFEKRIDAEHALRGTGLKLLQRACAAAGGTPVLALGGVTEANAAECVAVGAAGVAAIRMFLPLRDADISVRD